MIRQRRGVRKRPGQSPWQDRGECGRFESGTYADFVLNGTLCADCEVLTGNGRVRADDDAVYIDNLITSSAAGPLPALSRSRVPSGGDGLVIVIGRLRCRERDLFCSLVAVLTDAIPGQSL